jgi:hypothetical protein
MSQEAFDVRGLISPPFSACPQCEKTAFGVSWIDDHGYFYGNGNCAIAVWWLKDGKEKINKYSIVQTRLMPQN